VWPGWHGWVPRSALSSCTSASPPDGRPALILDRLVTRWLRGNTSLVLNEIRWSVPTYRRYLASMYGWADELAMAPDELEMCIFCEQAGLAGGQWA
jgi:8-oxoguanine DNA glycosylase-like protein